MIVINSMISMLNRGNKIQIQRNIIQFYSFPFFSLNPFVNILRKLPEHIFLFYEKHNIVTQTISVELFLNSLNNRTDKKSNIITIYENTIKKPAPM